MEDPKFGKHESDTCFRHSKVMSSGIFEVSAQEYPKVLPLRNVFPEVVMKAPTMKEIQKKLLKRGYLVSDVSFEKFAIENGKPLEHYLR